MYFLDNQEKRKEKILSFALLFCFLEKSFEIQKESFIFAKWKSPLINKMRIIARSTLVAYYTKNPQAKTALEEWYEKTKQAEWKSFADIKQTFNSVDSVGNKRYVFNIKGNDYRLVVIILFTPQRVYIRFVGTHAEYDKIMNIQRL